MSVVHIQKFIKPKNFKSYESYIRHDDGLNRTALNMGDLTDLNSLIDELDFYVESYREALETEDQGFLPCNVQEYMYSVISDIKSKLDQRIYREK